MRRASKVIQTTQYARLSNKVSRIWYSMNKITSAAKYVSPWTIYRYPGERMYEDKVKRDSLMKLIWLTIEPEIQSLVDRELGNFSRIPEYQELASELIRLRSRRRATSRRTCRN